MKISRPARALTAAVALAAALSTALPGAHGGTDAFPYGVAARAESTKAMLWSRSTGAGTFHYQVATDKAFDNIVANDSTSALETDDFTMKVTARGLDPDHVYYYRFYDEQGAQSDVGKFRTLPDPDVKADMKLALAGDSDILYQDHPEPQTEDFEVLRRILEDKPDLFVYMGDTIYSDSETGAPLAATLEEKWAKYQGNRIDLTQELLAAVSTWAVWDDHEVVNDFEGVQLAIDDPALLQAGIDAFNDYWPIDESTYYRKVAFGKKIDLIFLDERSYRTQNAEHSQGPCVDSDGDSDIAPTMPEEDRADLGLGPADPACIAELFDPSRTMLGAEQLAWFKKKLKNSDAKWKLIVNETPITQIFALPYDRWEGYHSERNEILSYIADKNIKNVVFLTTDHHAHFGGRVYIDITQEGAEPVAYEMVASPIQTATINQEVESILGIPNGGNILKNFLIDHGLVDLDCANVDEYGYGIVTTVDETAADLKLQWKSHTADGKGGRPVDDCPTVKLPKAFSIPG